MVFCFYQLNLLFSYSTVVRNGKSTAGHRSAISLLSPLQTWQLQFTYTTASQPFAMHQKIFNIFEAAMNGVDAATARIMGVSPTRFTSLEKTQAAVGNLVDASRAVTPRRLRGNGRTVLRRAKSRQRWLFYA